MNSENLKCFSSSSNRSGVLFYCKTDFWFSYQRGCRTSNIHIYLFQISVDQIMADDDSMSDDEQLDVKFLFFFSFSSNKSH